MHLLVQSIKRGGYFCIALPPTGWSPPLGKVSWNLPYEQCLLQHSEEFITVDYQSFLMHTKLIAVHFFPIVNSLGLLALLSMKAASQRFQVGQARAILLAHGLILSTY